MSEEPPPFRRDALFSGSDELIGRVLAERYELEELIGEGAFGRVYKARDLDRREYVAIKYPKDVARARSAVTEARRAQRLNHPHIAQIYDVRDGDETFISMQLIRGKKTLKIVLEEYHDQKAWELDQIVEFLRDVADAVGHAHKQKPPLVHRDLKPGNVMIDEEEGSAYVVDFGLAREVGVDQSVPSTFLEGTVAYMAPEQASGKVRPESDLYAIGVILYQLLTKRRPFEGTELEIVKQLTDRTAYPFLPSRLSPASPRSLEAIALRCLERDADRRYRAASELVEDLDCYLSRRPLVHARPPTWLGLLGRRFRGQPVAWALALVASILVLGVAVLVIRGLAVEASAARVERRLRAETEATLLESRLARLFDRRDRDPAPTVSEILLGAAELAAATSSIALQIDDQELLRRCRDVRRSAEALALLHADRLARPNIPWMLGAVPRPTCVAFGPHGEVVAGLEHLVVVASPERKDVLTEHTDEVTACAVSPEDELSVLSASRDGTLRLWSKSGTPRVFETSGHPQLACAFIPGGRLLVSGGEDGALLIWERVSGRSGTGDPRPPRPLRTLRGHRGPVLSCACSPDGLRILSGSSDRSLRLWDVATGGLLAVTESPEPVHVCAVSRRGDVLSSWGDDLVLLDGETLDRRAAVPTGRYGATRACAFSPDGERFVSGSADGTLRLWRTDGVALLGSFVGHARPVTACAFSRDGTRIVSASDEDRTIRLWDAGAGRQLGATRGRGSAVGSCAFSQDGALVIAGCWDGRLRFWSRASGALREERPVHEAPVLACAVSPLGEVLSGARDGTLSISTSTSTLALPRHEGPVVSCGFSADGKRCLSASWDGTIRVWDRATPSSVAVIASASARVIAAAISADGRRVFAVWSAPPLRGERGRQPEEAEALARPPLDRGPELQVWDVTRLDAPSVRNLPFPRVDAGLLSCALTRDGALAAVAATHGGLRFFDLETSPVVSRALTESAEDAARSCVFAPDGKTLLTTSGQSLVELWDVASSRRLASFDLGVASISGCAFSEDGRQIVAAAIDGTLRLFEPPAVVASIATGHSYMVQHCAFSPDGKQILSAGGGYSPALHLWDRATGKRVSTFANANVSAFDISRKCEVVTALEDGMGRWSLRGVAPLASIAYLGSKMGFAVTACAFSPDGSRVLAASADRKLHLRDAGTGAELWIPVEAHDSAIVSVAFSPDAKLAASASADRTLAFWEAETGLPVGRVDLPANATTCSFSPDDAEVLVGCSDGTLGLWDRDTGRPIRRFVGHPRYVSSAVFTPDGRFVLSGSTDGRVRLWDRSSGRLLRTYASGAAVTSVAIHPEERTLIALSGSSDRVLRVWDLRLPFELEDALPGFDRDPVGATRRALRNFQVFGRSLVPSGKELLPIDIPR